MLSNTTHTALHDYTGSSHAANGGSFTEMLRTFVRTLTSSEWSRKGPGQIRWAN